MKLVMTLMVRDEADIVGAMVEHHFAQGVSQAIITDNGSEDGTWKILCALAERYPIDLRMDLVHKKQQGEVVTQMARDAYSLYGADWVMNADADEFWLPLDRTKTVHGALCGVDRTIQSFAVPVRDMTGPPALAGTGLQRLVYQDPRTAEELQSVGLLAPSTHDCLHIGHPDVIVAQGNHEVSLPSHGTPPLEFSLEVLHFPWRSWRQFARKVANAGRAYLANPELRPSPNHHGMRDFRRYERGELLPHYVARCLDPTDTNRKPQKAPILDRAIAGSRRSPRRDRTLSRKEWAVLRELGELLIDLERVHDADGADEDPAYLTARSEALSLRERYLRERLPRRVRRLLAKNPF